MARKKETYRAVRINLTRADVKSGGIRTWRLLDHYPGMRVDAATSWRGRRWWWQGLYKRKAA